MNILISIVSMLVLIIGVISMVTPIPGGTIFIAGGLTGLICSSARARFCVKWIRMRVAWFNKAIFWMEEKVGPRVKVIGLALEQTRPDPVNAGDEILSHKDFIKKQQND